MLHALKIVGRARSRRTEPQENPDFEEYRYVVQEMYEEKTGRTMPLLDVPRPADPVGEPWDEDAVEAMLPELTEWTHGRD